MVVTDPSQTTSEESKEGGEDDLAVRIERLRARLNRDYVPGRTLGPELQELVDEIDRLVALAMQRRLAGSHVVRAGSRTTSQVARQTGPNHRSKTGGTS